MIGQIVSHYSILEHIGSGGMGVVYRAEDLTLGRIVAIKFLPPHLLADSDHKKRFLREAQAAAMLDHPNIATVHEIGEADGQSFIVMAFVEGRSLREIIQEGPLPLLRALDIARQIAAGLQAAHAAGIVHRDIKPANIIVGSNGLVKVVDFGLAKLSSRTQLTKTDATLGTVLYMSPEQASGGDVDHRSDIWWSGIVLYEMLTAQPPFRGEYDRAVLFAIVNQDPVQASDLRDEISTSLDSIIGRALTRDPDKRFSSAEELLVALEHESARVAAGARPGQWGSIRKLRRHKRAFLIATAVTLLAVAAGVSYQRGWVGSHVATNETAPAQRPWVLVAQLDAPQASLATAVRHMVIASLDESNIVQALPYEQIGMALTLAGKPDTTRVTGALARELAFRGGIKTVIEGRIDKLGTRYSLVLRAIDADDGTVICSANGTASNDDDLMAGIQRTVRDLRKGLGEKQASLVQKQLRWTAATPSFEAYRLYAEAFEMQQLQGDDRGSLGLLDRALNIDPQFAEAWALKGFGHFHLGESDAGYAAMSRALSYPLRLTEEGRMFIQGVLDTHNGNLERSDATYRELIRRGYQLSGSLGNQGDNLWQAGRYDEALVSYQRAAHVGPFGPQQWVLGSEIELLLMHGRVSEARAESVHLKGRYVDPMQLGIAVAANHWERTDSLARSVLADRTVESTTHDQAAVILACDRAACGSVDEAHAIIDGTIRGIRQTGSADGSSARDAKLYLSAVSDPETLRPSDLAELTNLELVVCGLVSAISNDMPFSQKTDRELKKRQAGASPPDGMVAELQSGLELEIQGQDAAAASTLARLSRRPYRPDTNVTPPFLRHITAIWYRDNPDSAVVYDTLALATDGLPWRERLDVRLFSTFVRLSMVESLCKLSRFDEAMRTMSELDHDVTAPDAAVAERMRRLRAMIPRYPQH